jgi:hypothetical protein
MVGVLVVNLGGQKVGDDHVGGHRAGVRHGLYYLKAPRSLDMSPTSGGATDSPRIGANWRSRSSCSLVKAFGRVHHDGDDQVAAASALQVWDTSAPQTDLLAALGSGRNVELLFAVEGLELYVHPERRLRRRPRARRPAGRSRGDSGRDGSGPASARRGHLADPPRGPPAPRPGRRRVDPSSTPAGTSTTKDRSSRRRPSPRHSGHGDGISSPGALRTGTGRGRDHLAEERLADPADFTGPWQVLQVIGVVPGRAPTRAGRARLRKADGQLVLDSEHRLVELEGESGLGVLTLAGPGPRCPAASRPMPAGPEEGVEEVSQPAPTETSEGVTAEPAAPAPRTPAAPNMSYWRRRSGSRKGLVGQVDPLEKLL